MMKMKDHKVNAIRLKENDNVAVLKSSLKKGSEVFYDDHDHYEIHKHHHYEIHDREKFILTCKETICSGHKIALKNLKKGDALVKYGHRIGIAKVAIQAGEHVHIHNVMMKSFRRNYEFCEDYKPVEIIDEKRRRSFRGFARNDGKVGTRNYIGIISSVNCSASVSRFVAEHFRRSQLNQDYENVDGVIAFTHKSGCGMLNSKPLEMLRRVLGGMAKHPNIGGYVMIGLGCEVNQITQMIQDQGLEEKGASPIYINIQTQGGVRKTTEAGIRAVANLLPKANAHQRTNHPISKLILGMNCGGSDGNSGISANPALGYASDLLIKQGATSVLGETTEIYGAEHLLTRRAVSKSVGKRLVQLIHWWEEHVKLHNASIDNNPSFGNKEGGITNICEKSLGAISKAGQSPLSEVYEYAQLVDKQGLCFMDTPGNDPVSMTGLVSGGCNISAFTTGRGSVYGCKPSPCIKISTHSDLYDWMKDDMDINAGTILDGTESVEEVGGRIFEKIISVANGEKTKSEKAGIGDEEFSPWMIGPVL